MFTDCLSFSAPNLPMGHGNYWGTRAVSTEQGLFVLVENMFYTLACDTESCKWEQMRQQLDRNARFAVMMELPEEYAC